MRFVSALAAASMLAATVILSQGSVAHAAFHCMRIHAVIAGYNGDNTIQYVELRMDAAGQSLVGGHTLKFYDGAGTLKATFTIPANVANGSTGDSILVATSEFNAAVTGGAADFTFSALNTVGANGGDPLHPVQGVNGRVHFAQGFDNCDGDFTVGAGEADSVSYGTAPPLFTAPAPALPGPATTQALRLNNLNLAPANNSTEYALATVSLTTATIAPANLTTNMETPRNNGRVVLQLTIVSSVGGIAEAPDVTTLPAATASSGHDYTVYVLSAAVALAAVLAGWRIRTRHRR